MPMTSVQEIATSIAESAKDIWNYDGDDSYGAADDALRFVLSQIRLRNELRNSIKILEQDCWTVRGATRLHKKVIRFLEKVFALEGPTAKCLALCQLEAHALILCAFSWRLEQIPDSSLDFFTANLEDFIRRHPNIRQSLYKHNIIRAVLKLESNRDAFKSFRKFLELQPAQPSAPTILSRSNLGVQDGDMRSKATSLGYSPQESSINHFRTSYSEVHPAKLPIMLYAPIDGTLAPEKRSRDDGSASVCEPLPKHTRLGDSPPETAPLLDLIGLRHVDNHAYIPYRIMTRATVQAASGHQEVSYPRKDFQLPENLELDELYTFLYDAKDGLNNGTKCMSILIPHQPGNDGFIVAQVEDDIAWKVVETLVPHLKRT